MIVDAHTRYAGFWRRAAALAVDWLLFGLAVSLVLSAFGAAPGLHWYGGAEWRPLLAAVPLLPLAAGVLTVLFWARLAATPGKVLMDCRVVDLRSGGRPGVAQAAGRCLAYLVSALPLGLGFLWIVWDRRRQGFHDKLARTAVVVDDESRKTLAELAEELR